VIETELRSLRDVMLERDRRYDQQFKSGETAVTAALSAQKELTAAAFASSEKAIVKAEEAQRAYNTSHNDLIRKMDSMIPRAEFDARIAGIDKDMAILRDFRSKTGGQSEQATSGRLQGQWVIGLVVGCALGLPGLIGMAIMLIKAVK
jgi:hypothetical protein